MWINLFVFCANERVLKIGCLFFRLPMASLSKFAICLSDQHLQHSPLMGHITNIVDKRLSSIHNVRLVI